MILNQTFTELNPQLVEELNKIYNRPTFRKWWRNQSPIKKMSWIFGKFSIGPTILQIYLEKEINICMTSTIVGLIDMVAMLKVM